MTFWVQKRQKRQSLGVQKYFSHLISSIVYKNNIHYTVFDIESHFYKLLVKWNMTMSTFKLLFFYRWDMFEDPRCSKWPKMWFFKKKSILGNRMAIFNWNYKFHVFKQFFLKYHRFFNFSIHFWSFLIFSLKKRQSTPSRKSTKLEKKCRKWKIQERPFLRNIVVKRRTRKFFEIIII